MSLLTEAKMPSLKDKINGFVEAKEKLEVAEEELKVVEEKVKKPKKAKK